MIPINLTTKDISDFNDKTTKISCHVNLLPNEVDGISKIADIHTFLSYLKQDLCAKAVFKSFLETGDLLTYIKY